MPNPISSWTEDDVLALPAGENDSFERKGSKLLDLRIPGVNEDEVLNELGKQLSAFSNTGGGQIIFGVANNGAVDNGGVAFSVKGRQSTKEWLEDVIPKLTEFEIVGFNVYEIVPKPASSSIASGKAIFVVDVPDSDRAPHQSKRDSKYYIRLGGKSHPAAHKLLEDIRNRQKHPIVEMDSIQLRVLGLPVVIQHQPDRFVLIDGDTRMELRFSIKNVGHIMARNACLRLESATPINWFGYDNTTVRRRGQSASFFGELIDPIYPGMEISFPIHASVQALYGRPLANSPLGGPWLIDGKKLSDIELKWWLFADNAPAKEGLATMEDLEFEKAASITLDDRPDKGLIRATYKLL